MNNSVSIGLWFVAGLALLPLIWSVFRILTLTVDEESAVILNRFGKTFRILREPGFTFLPERILPWVTTHTVSLKRDFRHYDEIHVNDCRGTTIVIDVWIEFRVVSPEKSLFHIENWEGSLQSLLTNSTTSILGTFEFQQILSNRSELGSMLKADIADETARWGLEINLVFISKLSLLADVSEQLFNTVAARLEKAKSDIEEVGRLEALTLEAETSAKVSALVAEAKGQHALGVSRVYKKLSQHPDVFKGYKQLYALSVLKPQRTVLFQGFGTEEFSAIEAAMTVPIGEVSAPVMQHKANGFESNMQ
ncbi:MAG: SPFH/Band 7/PHB domain protein [Chitinophagaceae bacterium]|nr:SPFH/Band 7/PHB domain protein [Oligoflexus sp.]